MQLCLERQEAKFPSADLRAKLLASLQSFFSLEITRVKVTPP